MTFVGTEDFQGPAQWQSLALLQEARTIANAATFQWPAGGGTFPVANWQSLQVGPSGSNAGVIDWIYQWYADSAGTILLGARLLSTTAVGADCFTLGNLGPFLTITALNNSGGSRSVAMYATLTNRIQAPFDPLSSAPVISVINQSVASGATVIRNADYLYAGPAFLWAYCDANSFDTLLQVVNSAGTTTPIADINITGYAVGQFRYYSVILPPRPAQLRFFNNDGVARTFNAALTADVFR